MNAYGCVSKRIIEFFSSLLAARGKREMEVDQDPGMTGPLQHRRKPSPGLNPEPGIIKRTGPPDPADRSDGVYTDIREAHILHAVCPPLQEFAEFYDIVELISLPEAETGTFPVCMGEETCNIADIPEPHHEVERIKHLQAGLLTRVHGIMVGDESIQWYRRIPAESRNNPEIGTLDSGSGSLSCGRILLECEEDGGSLIDL